MTELDKVLNKDLSDASKKHTHLCIKDWLIF